MLRSFVPWSLFFVLLVVIGILFKPITKILLGSYASVVLDANVSIDSLNILDSSLSASINTKENILHLTLLNIAPLKVNMAYKGDVSVFKKYQPVKGNVYIQGLFVYDKTLRKLRLALQSKKLSMQKQTIKGLTLQAKLHGKNFIIKGSFRTPFTGKTFISSVGSIGKKIQAQADIDFKKEHIHLSSVEFTKKQGLSLQLPIFEGELVATLKNKELSYHLHHINTEKLLFFMNKNLPILAYINAKGVLNLSSMNGNFSIDSQELLAYNQRFKKLFISGKMCLKTVEFTLQTEFKKQHMTLEGSVEYAQDPKVTLVSTQFASQSRLEYKKGHFWFRARHINAVAVQKAVGMEKYGDAAIDIDANGTLKNIDFTLKSPRLQILKYPHYFKNSVSLEIKGNLQKNMICFGAHLYNKSYNFFAKKALYDLHSKTLDMPATLKLLAQQKKQVLAIKLHTLLQAPYTSKVLITDKRDTIAINYFSYSKKEGVKSDFQVDIAELQKYKLLTKVAMKGPLNVRGSYDKHLVVTTPSLGGNLQVDIEKEAIFATFRALELSKIDNMFNKDALFLQGIVSGNISYHIPTKSASSYITITDVLFNGVDMDAQLSKLEGLLGLNVVQLGRQALQTFKYSKQQTMIQQAQINLSLNKKIVTLNDVAFATKKFRIALLGSFYDNGDIIALNVNILDKNGCAVFTQELSGNIRSPEVINSSGAVFEMVSHMPLAIINTGRKLIDFGTNSVDKVSSFAVNTTRISDKKISLTNDIAHGADAFITNTSSIVLPRECKIVYRGKIK